MKHLVLAACIALSGASLTACAQTSQPQAEGQKIAVGAEPAREPAYAAGSVEQRVRDVLRALGPNIRVESIGPAPIPGFREVIAGGRVVYVSDDGKHLLQGTLLDVDKREDLSELAMAKVRRQILQTLPMEDRIVFKPAGTPKHKVVVLTDVECGYCRKFHTDIAEYTRRGIEVEYLAFPRGGIGSDDYRKMVAVWCAPNRQQALTDAKNGRPVPLASCKRTPVDMQYNAGQRMGLEGTPMIISEDGQQLGGYLPPDALLQRLDALMAGGA